MIGAYLETHPTERLDNLLLHEMMPYIQSVHTNSCLVQTLHHGSGMNALRR